MTTIEIAIELLKRCPAEAPLIADLLDQLLHPDAKPKPVAGPPGRFDGLALAIVACRILQERKSPLSCMEIAKLAHAAGYNINDTVHQLRSKFAATISKQRRSVDSLFAQVGRGQIGLVEWK